MFTRTVEVTPKSGKARELASTINEKVLPILKKQPGFVDETLLVSDAEPNQILALSFWNTKEDAERYQREQYPAIHAKVISGVSEAVFQPHAQPKPGLVPRASPGRHAAQRDPVRLFS